MKVEQEFEIALPVDDVWDLFQDIPAVASCLPGARLTGDKGDGRYAGTMEARLGPMKATFEGEALVVMDHVARTAHIEGEGTDRRGGSRARALVNCGVSGDDTTTRVTVDADITLSGRAAQFGRTSLVQEIAHNLIAVFSECLEARFDSGDLQTHHDARPRGIRVGSLVVRSLAARVAAWLKHRLRRRQSEPDRNDDTSE